jgi:protease I
VNAGDYGAILILGGRAPEYLRHNAKLIEIARAFDAAGKWVFSICHGIQILAAAGLCRDRCVTCYEQVRFEAELAGGKYSTEQAVRDGRMVTAQTWQSHPEFYRLIFQCLGESGAARS